MTRLPVLSSRKVITALRRAGLVELTGRSKGSHHRLYHPNDLRIRREINESEGGQQRKNRITILLWENDG